MTLDLIVMVYNMHDDAGDIPKDWEKWSADSVFIVA